MTYPISSEVSSGQPTYASHYNNLRADALWCGSSNTDAYPLGEFLARYAANINIQYLAINRLRVSVDAFRPPAIMIGGCMLKISTYKDLPSGSFSGAAATWYIHAVRTTGSRGFTLSVNTTPVDTDTSRPIGSCYWDGTTITSITSYFPATNGMPDPSYDSGWFAVTAGTLYTKTHGMGSVPHIYLLLHSTNSSGSTENVVVTTVKVASQNYYYSPIGFDSNAAYIETGSDTSAGTLCSTRRLSGSGYYRLLAWS